VGDGQTTPIGHAAVRFSSVDEEIEPAMSSNSLDSTAGKPQLSGETEAEIRALSSSLHGTHLQTRRMSHFAFEPMSLPVSQVPSNEENVSGEPSQQRTHSSSGRPSPRVSPRSSTVHSPSLTPAASGSRDTPTEQATNDPSREKVNREIYPSAQVLLASPPISVASASISRPGSAGQLSTRPTSLSGESGTDSTKRHSPFFIGPGLSVPTSREVSPSRSATVAGAGFIKPFTPAGDANDPYAANKRPPQSTNLNAIEPRFVFSSLSSRRRHSPSSSSTSLPKSSRSSSDIKGGEKKQAGGKKDHLFHLHDDSSETVYSKGSMSDLKRFLKLGGHHKAKRSTSPSSSRSGARTPDHHKTPQLPFGDDHGLTSKYGKFGKVLGAGAGGSVRLMKRSSDGTTFAVKEFRARHAYETEKEYSKKVTAEFCIGSTLHHGNIIETLDIVQEKGRWYEVMEYAPYDLFAIVMTGKMSRQEIACSFFQILSGVTYLHNMGLAHRDLKLDNVVVNEFGIMKIIDFGSATIFKYSFESQIVLATGVVGSDPYLAPEVYGEREYDPQSADIWSLAIIFACMSLRRFPWKMPRMTDNSYKLFASPPTAGTEKHLPHAKSTSDISNTVSRDGEPSSPLATQGEAGESKTTTRTSVDSGEHRTEVVKGPWRLLRLLPRESRHIIGRMLEIDSRSRAKLPEILANEWVASTLICRQELDGTIIKAPEHLHTLEPPSPPDTTTK